MITCLNKGVTKLELYCRNTACFNHLFGAEQDIDLMAFGVDFKKVDVVEIGLLAGLVDRGDFDLRGADCYSRSGSVQRRG